MSRNPPRGQWRWHDRKPLSDALERRWVARCGAVPLAPDSWRVESGRIVRDYRQFGHAFRPDGSRVAFKGDAYTVQPAKVKALSDAARAWFKATLRNVRQSDARIKERTTLKTLAELNPNIAAREKRLRKWATGGQPDAWVSQETPGNYRGAFRYQAWTDDKGERRLGIVCLVCGLTSSVARWECCAGRRS